MYVTNIYYVVCLSPQDFWRDSSCASAGAEALFADLGHFSMRSIQVTQCYGTYAAVITAISVTECKALITRGTGNHVKTPILLLVCLSLQGYP